MLILGIESSCDDTSVALLECSGQGCFVISEKTASQIDVHKKYGGVVPEIAGRMHAEKIVPLIEAVLASPSFQEGARGSCRCSRSPNPLSGRGGQTRPNAIAVTSGPGLITGLLVGVEAARALSYAWNIPLVPVNHIEGHIYSVEIPNTKYQILDTINYPALALVVSGGHTELIFIKSLGKYKKIGATLDDAAGECFDKVAKLLNLPYPGGPQISRLAEFGNPQAINFPRPMLARQALGATEPKRSGGLCGGKRGGLNQNNFNFSFAGLKTSALYWLRDHTRGTFTFHLSPFTLNDFCASLEQAIIDVLVGKTIKAAEKFKPKTIILGGGVSANKKLRETLKKEIEKKLPNTKYQIPDTRYSMDNAVMIALAGWHNAKKKKFISWKKIKADPNWELASL